MRKTKAATKNEARVILADTKPGVEEAVHKVFDYFGGGNNLLRSSRDVYIKVNAVGSEAHVYTDLKVLRATINYFKQCGSTPDQRKIKRLPSKYCTPGVINITKWFNHFVNAHHELS